ncbi:MAG: MerR family transcriptional regulator [Longimicrobiales bacterium]|nr:MerR family transcriptional regulator [Longimicrobiales bacterium]
MAGERARDVARHPMGVVVERTGLTSHAIRAWERRYGAVDPARTEGGQRLYTDGQVLRLRLLKRATEGGHSISTVADLSTEDLAELIGDEGGARVGAGGNGGVRDRYLEMCLAAADRLDAQRLREELMRAVVSLSAPVFLTEVVGPLLARVGELWEEGSMRPAQEHVVSTAVRQVLDWLLGRYEASPEAPLMVAGTTDGELHEFGAMLAAVMAADAGWRVLYLGPSLPAEEIAAAAERASAAVVAVSVVDGESEDRERAARELVRLRDALPEGVLLVAGGRRSTEVVPEGVTVVEDLRALRHVLAAAGPPEEA